MTRPCFIRIAGEKNSGKTTLIVALIRELASRGLRVATLKHTSHDHEFDRPGTDSHRHTGAGSSASVIVSPGRIVYHAPRPAPGALNDLLKRFYQGCDIVLSEGSADLSPTSVPTPVIECIAPGAASRFGNTPDIVAVVTDEKRPFGVPAFTTSETGALADWLCRTYRLEPSRPQRHEP